MGLNDSLLGALLGGTPFGLAGAGLRAAQQAPFGGSQQAQYKAYCGQVKKPRRKVVSHTLSPQEAVNAAAKAVKDAQNLLT